MPAPRSTNRKEDILQALAAMLQSNNGQRITTAALAEKVGVSEAALYRHFPSKARMFEGLIEFIEDTLLSRINVILDEHKDTASRTELILQLILVFAERNPGICRILTGDALQGEQERLQERVVQLFEKLETQLKHKNTALTPALQLSSQPSGPSQWQLNSKIDLLSPRKQPELLTIGLADGQKIQLSFPAGQSADGNLAMMKQEFAKHQIELKQQGPVLVFGAGVVSYAARGLPVSGVLALLGAMMLASFTLAPAAVAAGLRISSGN